MYKEYKGLNLPEIDKDIQNFWDTEGVFEKSVTQRDPNNAFVFYEGPPSANGLPGIHHVMARTIKDIFCRFQTLNGKRVERKGGWDTHGLPIELAVEKELGITKEDIGKSISVDDYNHKCREVVMRYKDLWDDITRKMGYWVDLDNPYVTYENAYIETVWFLLKRLYDKGYLYKGYTIQPYSPAAGTGLSTHELNMPGAYKDIRDTSVTAQFEIKDAATLPSKLLGNAFYTEGGLFELKIKNSELKTGNDTLNDELKIKNSELKIGSDIKTYFVAWTTTPWTLPSNCALVVGGNLDYAAVESFNVYTGERGIFILAKALIAKNFDPKGENGDLDGYKLGDKQIPWRVLGECKGTDLEGVTYHQLMPYVAPNGEKAFEVLLGDFVTTEDGTGIVHTAALFGADDFKITKATGTAFITVKDDVEVDKDVPLVNKLGRFVKEVTDFAGEYVKEQYLTDAEKEAERERLGLKKYLSVDERIAIKLKTENKAFKVERYNHNYPHCWRTDKPILYYPLDSWFIAASKAKERMFELNKTINWKPAATGEGRFGKWLENLQDWNLSRSRYWGIGLPIWRTEVVEGKEMIEKCVGSIAELQFEINKANDVLGLNQTVPKDLHRPYIDDITLVTLDGRPMKRELDLIDVWFDSGSMPYAQWGLDQEKLIAGDEMPFKNPFNVSFPADFIAEGVDQTRGWFYTLHAIAVMAYDSVAFKNVVSNGLVQDKNGQKMSKSKGNAVEPFETIAKHGADATRWYMISNAQPWDNLKFDEGGITETRNKFFGTLYNSYNFFAMYANVDGFVQDEMNQTPIENRIELDRWILSKLHSLVAEVTELYATYEPTLAARAIEKFVDADFSNWYVRLSRRRFWKGEMSDDKKAAYETMYQCLMVTAQLSAPIAPYFSEWLYKNLTDNIRSKAVENNTPLRHPSVHLTDLTKSDKWLIDKDLEQRMDYAQRISSLILSLRKKEKIRVRQPLSRVLLPILDSTFIAQVEKVKDLILSETNVKAFEYITDASNVVTKKIKPNFKTLGKTLGANMKFAQAAIEALTQADIAQIEKEKTINLTLNGQMYPLSIDDFLITSEDIPGWLVANDGDVTVALDVTLTEELIAEGIARDLVNKIQTIRKEKNLSITDKISIKIEDDAFVSKALESFRSYIQSEVLSQDLFSTSLMKQRDSDYTVSESLKEDLKLSGSENFDKIDITDKLSLDIKIEKVEEDSENRQFIKRLIASLESDRLEKTVSTKNIDKFSEAICAFANDLPNHKQAGYLLIGVKDDGSLSGLKVTDELLKDIASIRNNGQILPQPAMIVEKYTFADGDVAVVQVLPSLNPPVRYRGRVWIRVGPTKQIASPDDEKRLAEKRTATSKTFDALPCHGATLEDLNVKIFKENYLLDAVASEVVRENNREADEQLGSLKMYDLLHNTPTNAGVLTLGFDSLDFMPGAYIQYVKFSGKSTDSIVNEKRFSGNLVELLKNLDDFVKNNVITQKPVFVSALREKPVFNYPYIAVREMLMNAIMHRNYESNAPIRFYEYSDRIEIQNPGALYGQANKTNFPRVSDYRNPLIAEVLKNLGYINRFNVGISNAKILLKENGNLEPNFDLEIEPNFLVTIFST